MKLETRSSSKILAIAFLLFVGITTVVLLTNQNHFDLPLLYVLPIGIIAASFGILIGLCGALLGCALFIFDIFVNGGNVPLMAYIIHFVGYLSIGLAMGYFKLQFDRSKARDSRWFEISNDMLVEASLDGYFIRLSDQWEITTGWTKEELMARPFREFIHPDDRDLTNVHADSLDAAPGEVTNFENRYLTKDGTYRWLLWSARSDNQRKFAVAKDVTDRKLLEEERHKLLKQVETLAMTDSLTSLPNRRAWDEEFNRELIRTRRRNSTLALAMIDLDNFKNFNDEYGHSVGDSLLAETALNWRSSLRETDFLARYGGEEFAILIPESNQSEVETIVGRIMSTIPKKQTCSVGIAFWRNSDTSQDLLNRADKALYEAKARGRNCYVIHSEDTITPQM